jgi:hypothetical protein
VTIKYLAKFQSPRAITQPKIIGPERNVHLICNLSLYTHIPNIKSISQSIAQKSGDHCFISELQTWVILYVRATQWSEHKQTEQVYLQLFSENRVTSEREYWSSKMVDEVGGPCRNLRYLL